MEELGALPERLNLAKYKGVMEENEVRFFKPLPPKLKEASCRPRERVQIQRFSNHVSDLHEVLRRGCGFAMRGYGGGRG